MQLLLKMFFTLVWSITFFLQMHLGITRLLLRATSALKFKSRLKLKLELLVIV